MGIVLVKICLLFYFKIKQLIKDMIMKKSILIFAICFYTTLCFGQKKLEGEWKFKKLELFGRAITFDNSEVDKKNLILSIIDIEGGEDNLKDSYKIKIKEKRNEIYNAYKKIYTSNIIFKNIKKDYYNAEFFKGDLINYEFTYENEQNEYEVESCEKEVKIIIKDENNMSMEVLDYSTYNEYEYFKLILNGNILEIVNDEDLYGNKGGEFKIAFERK